MPFTVRVRTHDEAQAAAFADAFFIFYDILITHLFYCLLRVSTQVLNLYIKEKVLHVV